MKRTLLLLAAAAVLTLGLASPPAAHASSVSGPDHLLLPVVGPSVYGTAFAVAGCPASMGLATNPLNGTDAAIFEVSGGGTVALTSAPLVDLSPTVQGTLSARFYTASCLAIVVLPTWPTPSTRAIAVPPGAKWMVIEAHNTAAVSFS